MPMHACMSCLQDYYCYARLLTASPAHRGQCGVETDTVNFTAVNYCVNGLYLGKSLAVIFHNMLLLFCESVHDAVFCPVAGLRVEEVDGCGMMGDLVVGIVSSMVGEPKVDFHGAVFLICRAGLRPHFLQLWLRFFNHETATDL